MRVAEPSIMLFCTIAAVAVCVVASVVVTYCSIPLLCTALCLQFAELGLLCR